MDGGESVLRPLLATGVQELFTLNGGHVWPIYAAAERLGVPIYDTRHEQTATFAAEGTAKLRRRPGLAVLTAGPGVTNGISAITAASMSGVPLVVVGGRAPLSNWGRGDLQELDHVPIVASITRYAATAARPDEIGPQVAEAVTRAVTPHRGPVFVDVPMDVLFRSSEAPVPAFTPPAPVEPDSDDVDRVAALLASAARPALLAGGDVWLGGAEDALRRCVESLRIPTFLNGQGRGCLPADHELFFARVRSALRRADVVAVVGTPLDFRVGFGAFGDAAVVHVADTPEEVATHRPLAASAAGDLALILDRLASWSGDRADHEPWIAALRDEEAAKRAAERELLAADAEPILPTRVYGELRARLDRDAVVVGDGGDFVSYAGRYVDAYHPGRWLDPGPYGCLGSGPGYAMAARLAHPDSQVVLLLGDGAFGFAGIDFDSLVRHRLPVVAIVGNNSMWGLEYHPQKQLMGSAPASELAPGTRYDQVVEALGGAGETVSSPAELGPALDRAFAAGVPYLVNVLTDPADAYPRSGGVG